MSSNAAIKPLAKAKGQREVFRQTRQHNDNDSLSMSINGINVDLKNWSRTGIGFEVQNSSMTLPMGESVKNITLHSGNVVIYEGDIHIRSSRQLDSGATFYGASFTSGLFLVEGVESANVVNECNASVRLVVDQVQQVKPEYCQAVITLAAALSQIKKHCETEELRWKKLPFDRRCEAERIFLPNMSHRVRDTLVAFNKRIAQMIDVEALPDGSPYHMICHQHIYPFFQGSDFIRRAYEKPRGYAGDYEMMNQIYRNSFEGNDLFGKVLHHYAIGEASSESVKFRRPYFMSYYQKIMAKPGPVKTLSVACGPAVEVQEFVSKTSQNDLDRIELTLFDLDREALEHAQTKIYDVAVTQGKEPNIHFVNASVKTFLASNAISGEKYDFIYSGGLFDYLDNVTSGALVTKFSEMLNPNGTLIIGNFTKDNSTKAFCHLLADWALIHKTEEEIRNWAADVKDCSLKIEYDQEGINAFLVLKKNAN